MQANNHILKPTRKYTHHSHVVNDVQYHPFNKNFIGTVSDDLTLQIIDVRRAETDKASLIAKGGHTDAINALGFCPTSEYLVATASGDKTIGIWDLRNIKEKVHTLEGHNDAVTSLSWHPTEPGVLGSGSYDRRIIFWDLTKIGDEQLPDDQEDGPPELYVAFFSPFFFLLQTLTSPLYSLFMHGGHTNHLADFTWNPNDPWLVCSAAEDNLLQIWKVADSIIHVHDKDLPMEELQS